MLKTTDSDNSRARDGQTLVEFALILLFLLAILFGLMEFARGWQYSNAVTNGVRDGVRYATTLDNTTSAKTKIKKYTLQQIADGIAQKDAVFAGVTVVYSDHTTLVTVSATADFVILTGKIIPGFSGTRKISRQATMRYKK